MRQADATNLPFVDGAFVVVNMLEVIEHISAAGQAIREAVRVARRHVLLNVPSKPDENPEHILGDVRMRAALVEAIKNLPEREQYIMSMYYEHDMNLKEIAAVLGVTESRICQLHSQSIARLRARMRDH